MLLKSMKIYMTAVCHVINKALSVVVFCLGKGPFKSGCCAKPPWEGHQPSETPALPPASQTSLCVGVGGGAAPGGLSWLSICLLLRS